MRKSKEAKQKRKRQLAAQIRKKRECLGFYHYRISYIVIAKNLGFGLTQF